MPQFLHVEVGYADTLFVVGETGDGLQACVVGDGVSVVVQAHPVFAHRVHRGNITLVLNGSRGYQHIPVLYAYGGPVCHYEQNVVLVFLPAPCPYGESQVVAYQESEACAAVGDDLIIFRQLACGEELCLAAVGIEVAFVHEDRRLCRSQEEGAVVEPPLVLADERADDSQMISIRAALQALHGLAVDSLRQLGTVGAEARAEHLRQQGYIGVSCQCSQALFRLPQIRLLICPSDGVLQQCYAHDGFPLMPVKGHTFSTNYR